MTLNRETVERIRPRIRSFRLIFAALIAGVALFGLLIIALVALKFDSQFSMLSLIIFGISALIGAQALVIPRMVGVGAIRQLAPTIAKLDPDQTETRFQIVSQTLGVWFTSTLIGVAMLEGAAFMNLVGAFVEGNAWHLVAAGLFLAMMVVFFPSENRVLGWIEQRLDDLQRAG